MIGFLSEVVIGNSRGWSMSYVDLIENVLYILVDCRIVLIEISVGCLGYDKDFETLGEQCFLDIFLYMFGILVCHRRVDYVFLYSWSKLFYTCVPSNMVGYICSIDSLYLQ